MTLYQIYTRVRHFFTAKHWRGYAVHSPFMYKFIRETVVGTPRKNLPAKINSAYGVGNTLIINKFAELPNKTVNDYDIIMVREPFSDRSEKLLWKRWYDGNHCVAAHLQGLLVIFLNKKLQKQFYKIRN